MGVTHTASLLLLLTAALLVLQNAAGVGLSESSRARVQEVLSSAGLEGATQRTVPSQSGAILAALLEELEEADATAGLAEHNCSLALELADLESVVGESGDTNGTAVTALQALQAMLSELGLDASHIGAINTDKLRLRLCLFANRFAKVTEHNQRTGKARFEVNFFALLRSEEASRFAGFVAPSADDLKDSVVREERTESDGGGGQGEARLLQEQSVVSDVDWTGTAVPTEAQNQGSCGSCWAFSAAEMIGALAYIQDNNDTTAYVMSAQQLTSCDESNGGCNGGNFQKVWTYYTPNTALAIAGTYPYASGGGTTGACDTTEEATGILNAASNVEMQSPGSNSRYASNALLQEVLLEHPVSIAISASTSCFQSYSSGVLHPSDCPNAMVPGSGQGCALDHAVLLVGYGNLGTDEAYYKVKNSWGGSWGEDGYVRFAIIDDADLESYSCYGMLGMGQSAAYPQTTGVLGTPGPTFSGATTVHGSVLHMVAWFGIALAFLRH